MTPDTLEADLRQLLGALLRVAPGGLPVDASRRTLEAWDSLRHLQLILALEEQYGIRFGDDELQSLDSLPALLAALKEKLP
jgi:acyl carrier protein